MTDIRNFCLYRCRFHPNSFVPDSLIFPAISQPITPHIFSEGDIANLLNATQYLRFNKRHPIRSQTIRIAILLLYTTGIRLGELLHLELGDYNLVEKTLFIRDTKFHKSRIIPLSPSVTVELDNYLKLRYENHSPINLTSPLIWNGSSSKKKGYTKGGIRNVWIALCSTLGLVTQKGKHPRIHDLRHSFAVNILQQWYKSGEDVQSKLPLLSTYMGHVHVYSTYYYLSFVEGIRSEVSTRFQQHFGNVVRTIDKNIYQK
jgi:integrase